MSTTFNLDSHILTVESSPLFFQTDLHSLISSEVITLTCFAGNLPRYFQLMLTRRRGITFLVCFSFSVLFRSIFIQNTKSS